MAGGLLCGALAAGVAFTQEPADGWRIRVDAAVTGLADKGRVTLGSGTGAAPGLDPFDVPHPPSLPNRFLDVYTEHLQTAPGWGGLFRSLTRYKAEFGPTLGAADRTIEIVVETDQAAPVQLTWQLEPNLDLAQHFLVLRDLESGQDTDMWVAGGYQFTPTGLTRRFQVRMTQGRSAPPIAYSQPASLPEDTSLALVLVAKDPEGDALDYEIVGAPARGSLIGIAPNLTYVPVADYYGPDSFTFKASDSQGASNTATVSLTVTPVNDAPHALPQSVTTQEDEATNITLLAADADADALTFTIVQAPQHGSLEGTAPNLTYRPQVNFNGPDSFTFSVTDGQLTSPASLLAIAIQAVADPPQAAFTVPGEAANVAVWDNNLASRFEGADATASSTIVGSSPVNAIDENLNTHWRSSTGQTGGATLTVNLPRGGTYKVDRFRIVNPASSEAVRRFEVQVSTTTTDPSAFTSVLTDLALNDARVQEFALAAAVDARFVRLRVLENFGSATAVSVSSFEVIGPGLGGLPSYSSIPVNVAASSEGAKVISVTSQSASAVASQAIDGNVLTLWTTATGQRTNQAIVVDLAREKTYSVSAVRIAIGTSAPAGQGIRNFSVAVSTTTAGPGAFVDVLSATVLNTASPQDFLLPGGPVAARYVRLTAVDNHGSACCVSVGDFQVLSANPGGASASSVDGAVDRVENMFDASIGTHWRTAVGRVSNQSVTIRLQAGRDHLVERVRLLSNAGVASLKDFTVQVSATTDADAAFSPVLSGTLLNNGQLQEFVFPAGPARARYLRLLALNNHGGTSIYVTTLQAITIATRGSVVSIPAPVAQLARNESPAQKANGAVVLAYSSVFSSSTPPTQMLDHVQDIPWATAGLNNQFALIRLARRSLVSAVRVSPRLDCCPTQSLRDFEVWTSDTTSEDSAFSLAVAGTVLNNGTIQEFTLPAPVHAAYVKYVPRNNYGDPAIISTTHFDVVAAGVGGVESASSASLANTPAMAFDGEVSTEWRTTPGALANQWVNVQLSGASVHRIFGVRIAPTPSVGPRNFEIRVSTTTPTEGAFATVAGGTLDGTAGVQEFGFAPVDARYVQFRWLSGYGASFIGVRDLEVLGSLSGGAMIRGFSSQTGATTTPALAVDADTSAGTWSTAAAAGGDQWLTLTLPGADAIAVDRVALQGPADDSSPREFEIQVSGTTVEPGAFTTVYAGTLRKDGLLQNFFFEAARARHLRLLLRNNYAGSGSIAVQNFRVFSPEFGEMSAQFQDLSSAVDGQVTGFAWEFGDAATSLLRDPGYLYFAPGVYPVRLTASADTGLNGALTRPYRAVAAPAPAMDFYPAAPREGQSVQFVDASSDPFGIVRREWSFGDGGVASGPTSSTTHSFSDNGVFAVTLKVTNSLGFSSTTSRQVTVTNVAPSVSAGLNRRWLANESINFNPTISDPGADPPACSWIFGDGTTSTGCNVAHAYTTPSQPAAAPIVFTATLAVNDGDVVVWSSVETTVFPSRMNVLASGLTNPVGIDWSPDLLKFVVANRYPNHQLVTVTPGGVVSPVLASGLGNNEVNLVVSPGLGGFAKSDVFYNIAGSQAVGRLKMDLAGNVTQIASPWSAQPTAAGSWGGITFDTQGGFGHDLLVVWNSGRIFRVNAAGQSTLLANIPSVGMEGATVAGPNFGPASGCLLTVDGITEKVWAVCPAGAPFLVLDMSGLTDHYISWVRYVSSPGSLIFTDWQFGKVLRGDTRAFGSGIVGHALISTEYFGEVWDLYYDASTASFQARLLALAPNSSNARLEDITFVPAHGQLTPSTGAADTGTVHTVTVLVKDEAGFPQIGLPMTFTVTGANPRVGTGATDASGLATFTYTGSIPGTDSIVASTPGLTTAAVSMTWLGNLAPTAQSQALSTPEDLPLAVTLVANDPEGGPLTYAIVSQPQHGTLMGVAPNVDYTPASDYTGLDSFSFTVTDLEGVTSSPATVSIAVTSVNDPPSSSAQAITTAEDTALPVTLTGSDIEGESLTFAVEAQPQHGTLSGTAPNLTYTPTADYFGPDAFTFTVTDPSGAASASAVVSITVTPVNDAPTATVQSVTTPEDTAVAITLSGTDPEGDALTFTITTQPQHGTLSGTAPNLTYTPTADYFGPDTFTFTVMDASGAASAGATVAMMSAPINDAPMATTQAITTAEDTAALITLAGTDVEGESLTFTITTQPQHGTLVGSGSNLTYLPAANYNGVDTFAFTTTDPSGATSAPAIVSIVMTFVNDIPVAFSEATSTIQEVPLEIRLTTHDIENDVLTYTIATPPQHGTLDGVAPNLTYRPSVGYSGSDSFTFQATDALGAISNIATITIQIQPLNTSNQPPVCSSATGPRLVWPPNHEMTPLSILGVSDPEGGAVSIAVTSVHQDEPLNATGDGDMSPDAVLSPPAIRAERRQNGNGRVYTVNFKALDPLGGSCVGVIKVCVPKSQSGKGSTCVDDGPTVESTGGVQ